MTGKDKHIPSYTSSDIEKYLSGELSASEMHALERAALDDPFLADALDGIALHRRLPQQPAFNQDVAGLRDRLQEHVQVKEKSKPRVVRLAVRYAAAIILLLGLGGTAYYLLSDKRLTETPLAKAEQQSPAPVILPDTTPAAAAPAQKDAALKDMAPNHSLAHTSPGARRPPLAGKVQQQVSPARDAAAVDEYKKEENEKQDKPAVQTEGRSAAQTISSSESFMLDTIKYRSDTAYFYNHELAVQRKAQPFAAFPATDQLVFSGRVTDVYNRPVPGAFLSLKNNTNVNATTDRNGLFNLRLNKMDTSSTLVVNHVGYELAVMALNTENIKGNIIQLQPQQRSLNEVTIIGYGTKRKELLRQNIDAPQKALSILAVPADGWPAYKSYLESNKSSVSLDSSLRGDETISFIVDKTGKLSSFKVEQSISPAHDSVVTRIIRQGPAWRLLSGKKARARVILTY